MTEFIDILDDHGFLTEDVLTARRYMANGICFDNETGIGCIGDARNIAYLGSVALIRPSRFLAVVPPEDIRSIAYMEAQILPIGTPHLEVSLPHDDVGLPRIREHEGRSRMSAILNKHGDVPVPICLFFSHDGFSLRAREIERHWVEKVSEGILREKRGGEPEWVMGPIFDQIMFMENGTNPVSICFREPTMAAAM